MSQKFKALQRAADAEAADARLDELRYIIERGLSTVWLERGLPQAAQVTELDRIVPRDGCSLMYSAVACCHPEAVALLLLHGVSPHAPAIVDPGGARDAVEVCERLSPSPARTLILQMLRDRDTDAALAFARARALGACVRWLTRSR